MKKVMFAAALVAASCAMAETTPCQLQPGPAPTKRAAVYAWKFTGKTTVGFPVRSTTIYTGSVCNLGSNTVTQCAIRIPGSLAIQGYTYICDNCCTGFKDTVGSACPDQFYMTKPFKSAVAASLAIDVAHVIGKNATQYEVAGNALFTVAEPSETYSLFFAGLGTYNRSWPSVASVSGNFAGKLDSPYYVSNGVCAPADYWDCNTLGFAGQPLDSSVAYGTWSVKLNTSASNKYRSTGVTVKVPAWADQCVRN